MEDISLCFNLKRYTICVITKLKYGKDQMIQTIIHISMLFMLSIRTKTIYTFTAVNVEKTPCIHFHIHHGGGIWEALAWSYTLKKLLYMLHIISVHQPSCFVITITIAASLKFSEILAATFSANWLGLQKRTDNKI